MRLDEAELVVFDWDGTVVDSIAVIAGSIQSAARDLGLRVPDDVQARHVIGLGLLDAMRLAVPDLPQERVNEFALRYRHHFFGATRHDVPFDGIAALLQGLRGAGRQLAVATGKSRKGLDRALQETGFGALFAVTRCGEEGHSKPHPWMLQDISEQTGVPRHRMVMVGDTTHDIGMAKAFGCASIGVLYGAHAGDELELSAPDALAQTVPQLSALLLPRAADCL